ncbi:HNH endonuclease signature motif containing protein [Nocardioides ultimimeridianus]
MVAGTVSLHPILACARSLQNDLAAVADMPADYLRTRDKADLLTDLAKVKAQLAELELRVLAAAADVAEEHGSRDAGCWLAHTTRITSSAGRAQLRLAESLEAHPLTAAAMREGAVNEAQARVIIRSVDKLSDAVDQSVRAQAEAHLIELAAIYDPKDLQVLGTKILEVVASDIAEAELGKQLEREEQAARDEVAIRIRKRGNGITRWICDLPDSVSERALTYLEAQDSPRVTQTRSRNRGEAFCRLLELLDPKRLPDHGGDATTVMVTIPLETLTHELGSAMLGDTAISASEARRLACTAKIIPVVLGGKSEPLDLGRSRRLFEPPQRKAMRIRDKRCRAEGCAIPAAWCEAHHLKPWSEGGRTDLADGVLLCSHHHHRAHDTRYDMTKLATGDYRFHRRT